MPVVIGDVVELVLRVDVTVVVALVVGVENEQLPNVPSDFDSTIALRYPTATLHDVLS